MKDLLPSEAGKRLHLAAVSLCAVLALGTLIITVELRHSQADAAARASDAATSLKQLVAGTTEYRSLVQQSAEYGAQGLDVSAVTAVYHRISQDLMTGNYQAAASQVAAQKTVLASLLSSKQAEDAKRGTLHGTVSGDGPLEAATVRIIQGGQPVATVLTDKAGAYSFTALAGSYSLSASFAGYLDLVQDGVAITAQQNLQHDVALTKIPPPTPAPTPAPTPKPASTPKPAATPTPAPASRDASTAYSTYRHTTIKASTGTFTADIMTFDLASGHIRVMEDTANDEDCANACAVKSVMNFVRQDGGFAGINGTYFCPTAYGASCAGKTNSFYWKQYNSRVQRMINPDNRLGEQDPFLVFDASGHATFLRRWVDYASSGITAYAGISCSPAIILGGQYAVDESTLDDKQRTAKVARGAVGLKGQTLYVVTIQGATVQDLGHAMQALGLDNAMNIDAGGSSGMVYQNTYKLGPGRDVPNALVFIEH